MNILARTYKSSATTAETRDPYKHLEIISFYLFHVDGFTI